VGSRTSSSSACDLTLHRTNFRPNRKNASKPKKLREATVGLRRCVHSNERTRIDLDFDFKSNVSKSYTSLPKKNFNPSNGLWELRIWDLGLEVRIRAHSCPPVAVHESAAGDPAALTVAHVCIAWVIYARIGSAAQAENGVELSTRDEGLTG